MAAEDPLDGENLIYAGHFYPAHGPAEEWADVYGAAAEQEPVMMTEFGWSEVDPADGVTHGTASWGHGFRDLVESHPNVGWVAWAFSAGWRPAMFSDRWTLLGGDAFMGHFVKEWLWERRDDRVPDAMPTDGAEYAGPSDSAAPPTPGGLETESIASERFEASWDRVTDDETTVQFYRVYVDGTPAAVTQGTSAMLSATPGERYEVRVAAADALSNESDRSDTVVQEMPSD